MPLSKKIINKDTADSLAIAFEPLNFEGQLSDQAMEYVNNKDSRGAFRVDKVLSEFTGIEELEKKSLQQDIADQALALSQEVQEEAHREAYQIGKKEGTEQAYQEEKNRIEDELKSIRDMVHELREVKNDMILKNEKQIVALCFYIAKRLLMKEIETNEGYVVSLIRKVVEVAQSEEDLTIRVSHEDFEWIEAHRESVFKDLDLDSSTKIEEDSMVNRGGVIVETGHGVIDATIEQRLEKLEEILNISE